MIYSIVNLNVTTIGNINSPKAIQTPYILVDHKIVVYNPWQCK